MKKWRDLKILHKGLILSGLLLSVELTLAGTLTMFLQQAESAALREAHLRDVSIRSSRLFGMLFDLDVCLLLATELGAPEYAGRTHAIQSEIDREFMVLERLLQDNPDFHQRLMECQQARRSSVVTEQILELARNGDLQRANALLKSPERVTEEQREMSTVITFVKDQEPLIREQVAARIQANENVQRWLAAAVGFNVLIGLLLFLVFVRGITRRIAILIDNTQKLAQEQPLNPVLTEGDEIGHLDRVFHQMADVLVEASRKERAITENAGDVICSLDSAGKILKINPASMPVWGYAPEQLRDQPLSKVVAGADLPVAMQALEKMKSGGVDVSFESSTQRGDGVSVDMLWSAHWSERDQCFFCVLHDITQRKRAQEMLRMSEARIQTILDTTLVGLVAVDQEGKIQHLNPQAERMLQYASGDLFGRNISVLFQKSDAAGDITFEQLSEESMQRPVELVARKRKGETLPVELSLSTIEAAGRPLLLANMVDITKRHELAAVKEEFVTLVSKDLRIPLGSVQGFLDSLVSNKYGELKDRGKRGADIAVRNVGRILRLIDDLVEVTKFRAGKLELSFKSCELSGILERSAEAAKVLADKQSIMLECDSARVELIADADRLERVVVNLLSNAVKFSPVESKVSVIGEDRGDRVLVKVIDRGRGIPASHVDLVFEKFKQVEVGDATQKGGTGLGLAICKAIIEGHGGEIGVESEEGKGSTFWFSIPCRRSDAG